jgi:hypothetical protein
MPFHTPFLKRRCEEEKKKKKERKEEKKKQTPALPPAFILLWRLSIRVMNCRAWLVPVLL